MLNRPRRTLRHDSHGVAALEFALILPLMITLIFGVYELSEPMIIYQEVFSAAHSIPASASSLAVQGDGSTALTYAQVQFEASTIFAEIPALRAGLQSTATDSVTISSVVFEPIAANCVPSQTNLCSFTPNVVWSVAYTGNNFNGVYRPCGGSILTMPGDTVSGDLSELPIQQITYAPDPILVVDVHVQYRPLLLAFTKTPIDFWATGYWPVRSVKAATVANGTSVPLKPDQQYTTLAMTGTPNGTCENTAYPEPTS
ncbi:MAG: pilus assembly protein [Acidiphilium sp.]|nr:pilus assembly protein [Acidiphilium sp.]MDD4935281.1 pilus assembly protein [Acidiphilium sp.]